MRLRSSLSSSTVNKKQKKTIIHLRHEIKRIDLCAFPWLVTQKQEQVFKIDAVQCEYYALLPMQDPACNPVKRGNPWHDRKSGQSRHNRTSRKRQDRSPWKN
jgi:hypothetical protein